MNILLTGATGFLGTNLLPFLASLESSKKNQIVILSHKKKIDPSYIYIDHKNYQFTKQDFIKQGIEHIDVVLHLGAFIPKNSSEANNIQGALSNTINTVHLCENLPTIPKKFIMASSIDVYGDCNHMINENTKAIPSTLYAQSKLFCEKVLEEWAKENKVVLQIARIGHLYGKGEDSYKKVIPEFIRNVLTGKPPIICSDGSEKRSFLNVVDCCKLIIKCMELEKYHGPINLVSNRSVAILELAEMIIELARKDITPIVYNQSLETRSILFDNIKMRELLGEETICLSEGLREEFEYFKSKINTN